MVTFASLLIREWFGLIKNFMDHLTAGKLWGYICKEPRVVELLTRCWHADAAQRPTFMEISDILKTLLLEARRTSLQLSI